MGGGKSKNIKKEISYDFLITKVLKVDQLFDEASKLLKRAEEIRSGLDDSRIKAITLTKCDWLKNSEDIQFQEAVRVLFWSLSGDAGGRIAQTGIRVSTEFPFLELNPYGRSVEVLDVYNHIQAFIKAVTSGPTSLNEIQTRLNQIVTQATGLKKTIKTEIKAAGLTPKDGLTATKSLTANLKKLPEEVNKVKTLPPLGDKALLTMKATAPKLGEMLTTADDVGRKIVAENMRAIPAAVFDKFHPGPKKTQQEYEIEKDPKKKGKKGKTPPPKDTKSKPAGSTSTNPTTNPTNPQLNPNPNQPNTMNQNLNIVNNPNNPGYNPNQPITGQPTNLQGQPTNLQGQPTNFQGQPTNLQGQPTTFQGQQTNLQGQPTNLQGQPTNLQGQPTTFQGQQTNLQGQPTTFQGQQTNLQGQPTNLQGQQTNFQGQPTTFQGQSTNLPGQQTNIQSGQFNTNLNANLSTNLKPNAQGNLGGSPFNTPLKIKSNQEEDIFDEEDETRQPVVRNIQESNVLHQSSIKRQKYIKTQK